MWIFLSNFKPTKSTTTPHPHQKEKLSFNEEEKFDIWRNMWLCGPFLKGTLFFKDLPKHAAYILNKYTYIR